MSENLKVIYDFNRDEIKLMDHDEKESSDGIIIGEYDGSSITVDGDVDEWFNANYFRKLWDYSFPMRDLDTLYLHDQNAVRRELSYLKARKAATPTVLEMPEVEADEESGFLRDPQKELYPPLWNGKKMRPEVKRQLEDYLFAAIGREYKPSHSWIRFTAFGSGASYNWDEVGDFDVHIWIDADAFNTDHSGLNYTSDQLLAALRRLIIPVNSVPLSEITGGEGKMAVQFYPLAGKGTKDECLATKPYACYDMESDTWYEEPKPITPDFYAGWFLVVEPKARLIAVQASALLDSLDLNQTDYMFWTALGRKYDNAQFAKRAEESKELAEQDWEAVRALWKQLFASRQEAYSPEGGGLDDERDMTNKILEVWGVGTRLKERAYTPLSWHTQELPEASKQSNVKTATWQDLMTKAQRLREDGQVHIIRNGTNHVVGRVQGDHGVYTTQIWRDDPASRAITMWDCECPWEDYAWQRTRQWKKYEGRPCSHALALYWESQATPAEGQLPPPTPSPTGVNVPSGPGSVPFGQLDQTPRPLAPEPVPDQRTFSPQPQPTDIPPAVFGPVPTQVPPIPGGVNSPLPPATQVAPNQVAPTGAPAAGIGGPGASRGPAPSRQSQPTPLGQGGTVSIPGALSSWKRPSDVWAVTGALFENGETVRANQPLSGIDRDGTQWEVPRNSKGEILSCDELTAVVIFPLHRAGILEPHLIRVVTPVTNLSSSDGTPFIRRRY